MSNKPKNPPAPRISNEVATLDSHLALLNSIPQIGAPDGVAPPPDVAAGGLPTPGLVIPAPEESPFITDTPPPAAEPAPRAGVQKLFFTGRLKSGKDHVAKAAGATIFGFADPLYAIAAHFFNLPVNANEGKDAPGMRAFLQTAGQWGRAVVSEQYPLTPARALFVKAVREAADSGKLGCPEVEWIAYGVNPDIWLNACIFRAELYINANPGKRVAITNCRFVNEFQRLQEEGFEHYHCMCGSKTWAARLAESKLTLESPSVRDTSEQLAAKLDQSVIQQLSAQKSGAMLKAIWSDPRAPKPSARLHSVDSFLQTIGGAAR
jgi:hypothetical protein